MRERWIGDSPKSLFPRRSTNCPALYAPCGRARAWEAAACDVETRIPDFHDAIVSPSTATCSITTVHCTPVMFHALRTTIAVDPADYRARKRREKESFDRSRRHFLKSVRGGARCSWRNRRFIYLSAAWKKPGAPHEVLYLSCKP